MLHELSQVSQLPVASSQPWLHEPSQRLGPSSQPLEHPVLHQASQDEVHAVTSQLLVHPASQPVQVSQLPSHPLLQPVSQ